MSYIGNPIYQAAFVTDQFSGTGSQTAYTMSVAPAGTSNVLVIVSGVVQDPSTYGVSGNTLTFSTAPPSGTANISCRYLGVPVTGIVTTAYRTKTEFTATAGQTTFTPPSYTVGYIDVFRNGVLLGSADYTATNGTTVVLATGATAGDLVTTESFRVDSVLNAIPNTAGSVSSSNIQTSVTLTTPTLISPIITGSTPQATFYTSGSGTYTTPAGCRYLYIEMVGGGGGGGGSGAGSAGTGGTGGTSTFGSALLTAVGGTGGSYAAIGYGGAGGTATINSPATGATFTGGLGGPATNGSGVVGYASGGASGAGIFGSGVGGGGVGGYNTSSGAPGSGGGSGGGIKAYISSPSSTYSYAVGAAGTAGTAGPSGVVGYAGNAGAIFITAFF